MPSVFNKRAPYWLVGMQIILAFASGFFHFPGNCSEPGTCSPSLIEFLVLLEPMRFSQRLERTSLPPLWYLLCILQPPRPPSSAGPLSWTQQDYDLLLGSPSPDRNLGVSCRQKVMTGVSWLFPSLGFRVLCCLLSSILDILISSYFYLFAVGEHIPYQLSLHGWKPTLLCKCLVLFLIFRFFYPT